MICIAQVQQSPLACSASAASKLWSHCALALTITLALATLAPSAQSQTFTVLHSFTGGADGAYPNGLIQNGAGTLYGSAQFGGNPTCNFGTPAGCGVVFKMDPITGKETVLHSFTDGADGGFPVSPLLLVGTVLYGTGCCGFFPDFGNVFKLDRGGNATVVYSFTGGSDGSTPGSLAHDAAGNLYGTTAAGGLLGCNPQGTGCGTVFKIDSAGSESVLYSFTGGSDGDEPGSLIRDSAGNLYGTTVYGGIPRCGFPGCGTVFRVDSAGNFSVLYRFTGGKDGIGPIALIRDSAGNLYGATYLGGGSGCSFGDGCGTVFKLDSSGKETVLYRFKDNADGDEPAGVIRDSAGNLYGTTYLGGNLACVTIYGFGCGTVFKLDSIGRKTVLYSFSGLDGAFPDTALIRDSAGNLYGTTRRGGTAGYGTVYKIAP